ncbi:MAG: TIR domain-containing protein [Crocosphaera sp.]
MKVFISWSGKTSRQVAECFRELLPYMFERIEPFASFEDIEKGQQGIVKILQELENTKFGIICLTKESIHSPWLNFEAGALAKSPDSRLYTFLFGIKREELNNSPLKDFQSTSYEKANVKQLIETMNKKYDSPLYFNILNNKFEDFWTKLDNQLKPIYESLKKTVILILEEANLNLNQETADLKRAFPNNINIQSYPIDEIEIISNFDSIGLIIYVYTKSSQSKDKLEKILESKKSKPENISPPLIIYTLNNKKLDDNEFSMTKPHKVKFANFPDTLIERCKEVLK